MDKITVRKQVLCQLKSLTNENRMEQMHKVCERLFWLREWQAAQTVGVTYPLWFEFPLVNVWQQARMEGKELYLPIAHANRAMDFVRWDEGMALKQSSFGIFEPSQNHDHVELTKIDLMIVPGIAYTKKRDRIGFGGGYYDRLLANYSGNSISLAFSEQLVPCSNSWQGESTDVKVQMIITAERIFSE